MSDWVITSRTQISAESLIKQLNHQPKPRQISDEIVCEWGISSLEEALIPGLVFLGMAIGSFSSGIWSDKYGRKRVMVIVYYCFAVFAIASAFAWSYISFLILRVCVGKLQETTGPSKHSGRNRYLKSRDWLSANEGPVFHNLVGSYQTPHT